MDFQNVKLVFDKEKTFPDTGVPFKLKKMVFPKAAKEFKTEYDDFMELCNSTKTEGPFFAKDPYFDNGSEAGINIKVFKGVPRTFTFLGMDVTEDLDVVIKGSFSAVYVGNLVNPDILREVASSAPNSSDEIIEALVRGVSKDNVRAAVENLKLENLYALQSSYSTPGKRHYVKDEPPRGNTGGFRFLDGVVEEVMGAKDSMYSSVILNFINESVSVKTSSNLSFDDWEKHVYGAICRYWEQLSMRYKKMSVLLSTYSLFYGYIKRRYGREFAIKTVKDSIVSGQYGDIGCFEGFAKDGNINGRQTMCDLGGELVRNIRVLKVTGSTAFTNPIENYMCTMFDVPNNIDITKFSREDALAYSTLDTLKYVDTDLELSPKQFDMTNIDERDTYLKTVITGYKKKFTTYWKGNTLGTFMNFDLDDNIIKNILPVEQNSVDILGITKSVDNSVDADTDIEVSRASFNKTNLMNVCRLVDKLMKLLIKKF